MFGKPHTAETSLGIMDMQPDSFHEIFELVKFAELKSHVLEDLLSGSRQAYTAITDDQLGHAIEAFEMQEK